MVLLRRFSRGSAQTILPPNKNARGGRLSGSYDNQIKNLENEASKTKEHAQQGRGRKRHKEEELSSLLDKMNNAKVSTFSLKFSFECRSNCLLTKCFCGYTRRRLKDRTGICKEILMFQCL